MAKKKQKIIEALTLPRDVVVTAPSPLTEVVPVDDKGKYYEGLSAPITETENGISIDFVPLLRKRDISGGHNIQVEGVESEKELRRRIEERATDALAASGGSPYKGKYDIETAAVICELLAAGMSMSRISKLPNMPQSYVIWYWCLKHPEFKEAIELAQDHRCLSLSEEIIDIADNSEGDWYTDEFGRKRFDNEGFQRSRLRIETRKFLLAKLQANRFGEKIEVTGKGGAALTPVINVSFTNIEES